MGDRTETLRLRVSTEEKAEIERRSGGNVSEYLRSRALGSEARSRGERSPIPAAATADPGSEDLREREYNVWQVNHRMGFHGESKDKAMRAVAKGEPCECMKAGD